MRHSASVTATAIFVALAGASGAETLESASKIDDHMQRVEALLAAETGTTGSR